MERNAVLPVKVGDKIESTCISIGKKGDGVFKHEGFIIIVPNAKIGMTYKLEITRITDTLFETKVAFARIV